MVQCASAISLTAASDPGGRCQRRVQTMPKVDHMQGYKLASITWLIEAGEYGNERFCRRRNLSIRPGLGIMESGDAWKGPSTDSIEPE